MKSANGIASHAISVFRIVEGMLRFSTVFRCFRTYLGALCALRTQCSQVRESKRLFQQHFVTAGSKNNDETNF